MGRLIDILLLASAATIVLMGISAAIQARRSKLPHLGKMGAVWIVAGIGLAGIHLMHRAGLLPHPWSTALLGILFVSSTFAIRRARKGRAP